jgi:Putative zinc-finger
MNSTSQLDFHPDAESLNAFVERALPERERGQVLAHLASCGRCRQVVYLAQQAAGEAETAGASASQPAAIRPVRIRFVPWLRDWRIAWVPAAALAAIIAVAVVVQVRHGGPVSKSGPAREQEMARVEPQPQIQANGEKSAGNSIGFPPVSPAPTRQLEKKALSATEPMTSRPSLERAVPPPAPPPEADTTVVAQDSLNAVVSQPRTVFHGSAAQASAVHGPASQTQQSWSNSQQAAPYPQMPSTSAAGSFVSADSNSVQAKTDSKEDRAQSSSALSLTETEKDKSLGAPAVSHAGFDGAKKQSAATAGFALKAIPLKLPSALTVQSIATGQHRTLAIDVAGAVFLRKDVEVNWETVAQPWTGRAVLVRFREAAPKADAAGRAGTQVGGPVNRAGGANGKDGFNGGVIAGTLTPPGVFEIETESGQLWVSVNGEDWKTK